MQRVISVSTCAALVSVALGAGCAWMFPEKIGAGAARLTVRNSIKLLSLLDQDTTCGFSSDDVKYGYVQDGELGSTGTVTWTVEGCALNFGEELKEVQTDCNGSVTTASGTAKVTATRTVTGVLTGNREQPVIPESPDAVVVKLKADVKDYEIRFSDRETALKMYKGKIDMVVSIHLAQSASLGVCGVPTNDGTINSIKVTDAAYSMKNGPDVYEVDEVPLVDIEAQLGKYGDYENYLAGKIQVWDTMVDLNDNHELDDLYDAKEFRNAYTCLPDLKLPVTFECLSVVPALADGAAKLTINNTGNLVSAVVADTSCGFASPSVVANASVTGEVGKEGGAVTYTISEPCTLFYPTKTELTTDCNGKTTYAEGSASVTGTMTVRGRRTGNALQPIIPTSREPALIQFNATFDGFRVSDSTSDQSLEIVHGSLSGSMRPRMAIDTITGACSVATPVVTFEDITWGAGGEAIVRAQGNALRIHIDGGKLQATNGDHGDRANYLAGNIIVNGDAYNIPLSGAPVLDPAYDAGNFANGYACTPNMVEPASDEQCNFHQIIADGAARLVIQSAGTVAQLINLDDSCGFADMLGVLVSPTDVQGDPGEMGSMTWHVDDCELGSDDLIEHSADCSGGITYLAGHANISSTRTVYGERETKFFVIDSIIPRDDEAVDVWLEDVELTEFVSYPIAAGEDEPLGILTIHSGTLSAFVQPATGARADDPSQWDVPTPVAKLSSVVLRDAVATLEAQGMIFEINIPATELYATNGTYRGASNAISGTINIDGDEVQVGGGGLNPTFNQAAFDASYVCTENLDDVIH